MKIESIFKKKKAVWMAGVASLALLSLSFIQSSYAETHQGSVEVKAISPKLKYSEVPEGESVAECDSFLAELMIKFTDRGYYSIPAKNLKGKNVFVLDRMNAIFTSEMAEQMAFVKLGVKISDSKEVGKLLRVSEGSYVFHETTKTGIPYALILNGFSEQDALTMVQATITASYAPLRTKSYVAKVMDCLVPSANAADSAKCVLPAGAGAAAGLAGGARSVKEISASLTKDSKTDYWAGCLECFKNAAIGALFSTTVGGGVGIGMMAAAGATVVYNAGFKGSVTAVANATKKAQEIFSSLSKDFVNELAGYTAKGYNSALDWAKKNPQEVLNFFCGTVAGLSKNVLREGMENAAKAMGINAMFKGLLAKGAAKAGLKKAETAVAAATVAANEAKVAEAKAVTAKAIEEARTGQSAAAKAADAEAQKAIANAKSGPKASDVVKTGPAVPAQATASVEKGGAFTGSSTTSGKSAGSFGNAVEVAPTFNAEVKKAVVGDKAFQKFLADAGIKEAQSKPFLEQVAIAAAGGKLEGEGREALALGMLDMKPAQRKEFFSRVTKTVSDARGNPAVLNTAYNDAERTLKIALDPGEYPELLKMGLKREENISVSWIINDAEKAGKSPKEIKKALGEAKQACAVP
jgi:hypothetical protein